MNENTVTRNFLHKNFVNKINANYGSLFPHPTLSLKEEGLLHIKQFLGSFAPDSHHVVHIQHCTID